MGIDRKKLAVNTMVIAVGGNSLVRAGQQGTPAEQRANARVTAEAIVGFVRAGHRVVVTHGNGPQVGAEFLRSERASDQVPAQTLDACVAASQGEIGYLLAQSLRNALAEAHLSTPVVSVISQTVVSGDDPAISNPTKPVGPFYSRAEAEQRQRLFGWRTVEDAAHGYRRVVASPKPLAIVELEVIRALVKDGVLVVACGGGGIPVVRSDNDLCGLEAVVDKDRVSALLASQLGAEVLLISTDTDRVYLDYRQPTRRPLGKVSVSEMEMYLRLGQFPAGNMGPKVESALRFLRSGGKLVVITSYDRLSAALESSVGTRIEPDQGATFEMDLLRELRCAS